MSFGTSARWAARMFARLALPLIASLAVYGTAHAHATGASYLDVTADAHGTGYAATWDIALADLQAALEIDQDGDGAVSGDELIASRARVERFVIERLSIARGGERCRTESRGIAVGLRESVRYASLQLAGSCAQRGALTVSSRLFFGSPGYSLLLDVAQDRQRFPGVLTLANATWTEPADASWFSTLHRFVGAGIWHVLIGYDHIAFLLLLLLPGVLRKTETGWSMAMRPRAVVADLLRIVTSFTLAHSITLGLAASGAVHVPVRPVELAIAGSIVVAGLLNLSTAAARGRIVLALGFGLVHGFGFANALQQMPSGPHQFAPMLAGFNIGVELAQLMIVALVLPVLWRLSRTPRYAQHWMPAMSLVTAVTGAVWFAGRW